jgi:alpha-D-ribose 1-methylphosphonate 5-triphosphate diphosphatase
MDYVIENCRIPTRQAGVKTAAVAVAEGRIAGIDAAGGSDRIRIDGAGMMLLPGIVDVHGDAFERQLMPRPGVAFPLDVALLDTDHQMTANGITTGFHGITHSWEPGLRSGSSASSIVRAIHAMRPRFGCDVRVHLRFETYALDGVECGDRNDRSRPRRRSRVQRPRSALSAEAGAAGQARAGGGQGGADRSRIRFPSRSCPGAGDAVPEVVSRLADRAIAAGVALLSHDDEDPGMRRGYHEKGCRICEFPVDAETARTARELSDDVVLGAPNILRGASHCGRLTAAGAIAEGLCTILASDYYYPSLLQAVFRIAADGIIPFEQAWNLVSATPARALGLVDRGEIAPGQRADLILVDDSRPELPRVAATLVAGRPVFVDGRRFATWAEDVETMAA